MSLSTSLLHTYWVRLPRSPLFTEVFYHGVELVSGHHPFWHPELPTGGISVILSVTLSLTYTAHGHAHTMLCSESQKCCFSLLSAQSMTAKICYVIEVPGHRTLRGFSVINASRWLVRCCGSVPWEHSSRNKQPVPPSLSPRVSYVATVCLSLGFTARPDPEGSGNGLV